MQVSVETTNGLERRMTVTVPAERIDKEVATRLQSLSRTVKMSGFRPGKVPLKVVATRYGAQVHNEVISEVTRSTFQEAVTNENIKLVGMPNIEPVSVETGKDLEYVATFEVLGEVELVAMDSLQIEKPVADITDQDVDTVIETLRKQHATWEEVERPAEKDDRLIIDFEGTVDGEPFDGNSGQQTPLILGSDSYISGFEDQLVGAKAGDDVTLSLTFPEDYRATELAGKQVQFQVKVHTVSKAILPEIDEAFMSLFEVKDCDKETFFSDVRDNMSKELTQVIKEKLKQNVLSALYEKNPVDVPSALVNSTIDDMIAQLNSNAEGQAGDVSALLENREVFTEPAKRKVSLGMLVGDIARKNDFKPEMEQIRALIDSIAENYDDPEEVMRWYLSDQSRLANVETLVVEDMVVDWVMEQAAVSEKTYSFEEIMKSRQSV